MLNLIEKKKLKITDFDRGSDKNHDVIEQVVKF